MEYTIERLQSDVMVRLGEIARPLPVLSGVPSPVDVISMKVEGLLPEVGSRLLLDASAELLRREEDSSVEIVMRMMPSGLYGVEFPLPSGFLRFVSMQMSGWVRSVERLILPGSAEWGCQWSLEEGIAGCPERPRVYLDGGLIRAMGSKSETDTLEYFSCCCIPSPNSEGRFCFPAHLYPALVAGLAGSLLSG